MKPQTEIRTVKMPVSPEKLTIYRTELADLGIAHDELSSRREGLMKDIKVNLKEQDRVRRILKFGQEEMEETEAESKRHILRDITADRRTQLEGRNADLVQEHEDLSSKRGAVMKELKVNEEEQAKRRQAIKYRSEELEVECQWHLDHEAGRAYLINPVTFEHIGEARPLSDAERNLAFNFSGSRLRKAERLAKVDADGPADIADGPVVSHADASDATDEPCGFCGLACHAGAGVREVDTLDDHSTEAYSPCPASGLTRIEASALRALVRANSTEEPETPRLISVCRDDVTRMTQTELEDIVKLELVEHESSKSGGDESRYEALLGQFCPDGAQTLKPAAVGKLMQAAAAAGFGSDGDDFRAWLMGQKLTALARKKVMAWDIGKE